ELSCSVFTQEPSCYAAAPGYYEMRGARVGQTGRFARVSRKTARRSQGKAASLPYLFLKSITKSSFNTTGRRSDSGNSHRKRHYSFRRARSGALTLLTRCFYPAAKLS